MVKPIQRKITRGISWLAGLTETLTGLGLIVQPVFTLKLMGLEESAASIPFIQFIGAFVLGIGSLYLWGLGLSKSQQSWTPLKHAWMATGWTRVLIGLTTGFLILNGSLSTGWASVPITDLSLGIFQLLWIAANRIPEND
jgi:hypothetical protein